nr:pentatricopeptide repeat-containing protein At1g52620 [Ipomoea batatas]
MLKSPPSRIKPRRNKKPNRSSPSTIRVAPHTKERVIETRFSEAHVVPSEIAYVTADRFRRPAQPKLGPQSSLWNSQWKLSS